MRDPRTRIRRLAELARPTGLDLARDARRFAASHSLAGSLREQIRRYQWAQKYGLRLLPPMRLDVGLVVDAGANEGAFTQTVLAIDPRARVLAIEPAPGPAAELRRRFGG